MIQVGSCVLSAVLLCMWFLCYEGYMQMIMHFLSNIPSGTLLCIGWILMSLLIYLFIIEHLLAQSFMHSGLVLPIIILLCLDLTCDIWPVQWMLSLCSFFPHLCTLSPILTYHLKCWLTLIFSLSIFIVRICCLFSISICALCFQSQFTLFVTGYWMMMMPMQENNRSELERLDTERQADFLNMLKGFVVNQVRFM